MRQQWADFIGAYRYRLELSDASGRWVLIRERHPHQDDEIVARGRHIGPITPNEIRADVADELDEIARCIREADDGQQAT
jgi:hypothetical protein